MHITALAPSPDPDPSNDLRALFDADAAASSELEQRRRARILVADLVAAVDFEDEVLRSVYVDYVAAFETRDFDGMADAYLDAADMDAARPGQPKLTDLLDEVSSTRIARVA